MGHEPCRLGWLLYSVSLYRSLGLYPSLGPYALADGPITLLVNLLSTLRGGYWANLNSKALNY
jgi:hypothetical protein